MGNHILCRIRIYRYTGYLLLYVHVSIYISSHKTRTQQIRLPQQYPRNVLWMMTVVLEKLARMAHALHLSVLRMKIALMVTFVIQTQIHASTSVILPTLMWNAVRIQTAQIPLQFVIWDLIHVRLL